MLNSLRLIFFFSLRLRALGHSFGYTPALGFSKPDILSVLYVSVFCFILFVFFSRGGGGEEEFTSLLLTINRYKVFDDFFPYCVLGPRFFVPC